MFARRVQYLMLLAGVGIYYLASGEWISLILLLTMLGLPWLSLLLSLPAILDFRASPAGAEAVDIGGDGELWLLGSSNLPMPPFRGRIRVEECLTGRKWRYETSLPTDHCGGYHVTLEKVRICDYLGLFSFPVRKKEEKTFLVRPNAVAVTDLSDPKRLEANLWVPKPGGGYSENHEHRQYRPGDSLNQVHWKLSAKVGELIIREPMQPVRGIVLLSMTLRGDAEELDRKFGRMIWMSNYLLERQIAFELQVLTGLGLQTWHLESAEDLQRAVDALLCTPMAESGSVRDFQTRASWQYHIGGEPDEG